MNKVPLDSIVAGWVVKLIWVPIIGPVLVWLVKKVASDVYTKSEVDDRIELKMEPFQKDLNALSKSLDRHSSSVDNLSNCIASLDKRLAVNEAKDELRADLNGESS